MARNRASTLLLLPPGLLLIFLEYMGLFWTVTELTSDSYLCSPSEFESAWRGWASGICLTEEQVWCRANGNRHSDCATADCRAEEIRYSLHRQRTAPPRTPVYSDCAYNVYDHFIAMNADNTNGEWAGGRSGVGVQCGVCVPPTDRRAAYLPHCDESKARCRSPYFRPSRVRYTNETIDWWTCGNREYENAWSSGLCPSLT